MRHHCVVLLNSSEHISYLLRLLVSVTRPTDIWRINEVDRLNQLYDQYNGVDLSYNEITELVNSIDTIAFLDIIVVSELGEQIIRLYCFDCSYIDITTISDGIYDLFVSYVIDHHIGQLI